MSDTVIVAIPAADERVYQVSSEKVPHLTILNLGDLSASPKLSSVLEFVGHASTFLDPFYLTVDYRDTLGPDNADVLFFEKSEWDMRDIVRFRSSLLANDTIKVAYDSVQQYPEWTPHLTLGYPTSPAKEDPEGRALHMVRFDRVAVWTGDFEGPEFRLKYNRTGDGAMEVAMSDTALTEIGASAVENLLQHHGVKGMRWGFHKADTAGGGKSSGSAPRGKFKRGLTKAGVATDAGAKIINEGEKKLIFLPHADRARAASRTQARMIVSAAKVNKQPQFKGKDLKTSPQLKTSYFNKLTEEAKTIYAEELHISRVEAWGHVLNIDTSATTNQIRISAAVNKIRHAAMPDETLLLMDLIVDDNGQVTDINVPDAYLKQDAFEDNLHTLVHHGVKGMRWGYTMKDGGLHPTGSRSRKAILGPKDAVVTQRKAGQYVQTRGGKRHPATIDAIATQAARQIAKKSTTDALSNKQLKSTIERMNLETQYHSLNKKVQRQTRGQRVAQLLKSSGALKATVDHASKIRKDGTSLGTH